MDEVRSGCAAELHALIMDAVSKTRTCSLTTEACCLPAVMEYKPNKGIGPSVAGMDLMVLDTVCCMSNKKSVLLCVRYLFVHTTCSNIHTSASSDVHPCNKYRQYQLSSTTHTKIMLFTKADLLLNHIND